MGIFDRFKKKEPEYDPTQLSIKDLNMGFIFEYDLKTWVVDAIYEYDWGDNFFSYEYKINSGDEIKYLHIEEDDELIITISDKIKPRAIDEDLPEFIEEHSKPPKKLIYQGMKFYFDKENPGYYHEVGKPDDNWVEFISWEYYDEQDKQVITIEQWDEKEFEASYGIIAKEFEFSNILPKEGNT
mgnify:CR=1 FL=1